MSHEKGLLSDVPPVSPACRAIVIIPAKDEADSLPRALDGLRKQTDCAGNPLAADSYEVLVLLNNCSDDTAAIASAYRAQHPGFALLVLEREYEADRAHVGTARREAMEFAWERLNVSSNGFAILSTDADTVCASDWIAQTLRCFEQGADAVGGTIELFPEDRNALESFLRRAYERDAHYQRAVAELESALDPDRADPWPRHLQHFGASLACTTQMYRRVGGMPAVTPLEDVAFVDSLRRADAHIRHSPLVRVFTSARLDGRAQVGLSGQLRHWRDLHLAGLPHLVESAAWLQHRFRTLAVLRAFNERRCEVLPCAPEDTAWHDTARHLRAERISNASFLGRLDCDRWIEETFSTCYPGASKHEEIDAAMETIAGIMERRRVAPAHRA